MERGTKGEKLNTKLFPHHHYNIRFGSRKQLKNMIGILGGAPKKVEFPHFFDLADIRAS
jgi:hypothetical protein